MEFMKRLEPLWLALVVIGALNWLMVGLFDTNVVTEIFGSGTASDVVYVIVGHRRPRHAAAAVRGRPPGGRPHAPDGRLTR